MIVLAGGRPIRARILEVRFLLGELIEIKLESPDHWSGLFLFLPTVMLLPRRLSAG